MRVKRRHERQKKHSPRRSLDTVMKNGMQAASPYQLTTRSRRHVPQDEGLDQPGANGYENLLDVNPAASAKRRYVLVPLCTAVSIPPEIAKYKVKADAQMHGLPGPSLSPVPPRTTLRRMRRDGPPPQPEICPVRPERHMRK